MTILWVHDFYGVYGLAVLGLWSFGPSGVLPLPYRCLFSFVAFWPILVSFIVTAVWRVIGAKTPS